MLDVGGEYSAHALRHFTRVSEDSSLRLAVTAFSLAVFGLGRRVKEALEAADKIYAMSVAKVRREIVELSSETIDQILVATVLMATYDVRFNPTDASSRLFVDY